MGNISLIVSLVLIGLFAIAITTFAINFAYDNGTETNLINDPDFTKMKGEVLSNTTAFYSDVEVISNATQQSTISTQIEATEGGTAFKVGPATALSVAFSVISISFKKIFGADTGFGIFLTALISVLGFIMAMYIYKAWAGRNPD